MREGPPSETDVSPSPSSSEINREILSLRSRLRELEDDTKSSVSDAMTHEKESEIMLLLRNQLSKVETEKATQEKDFMNQLNAQALDHQRTVDEYKEKLFRYESENDDLNQRLRTTDSGDEIERLARRLEEERKIHNEEMEHMRKNIQFADDEIAESRREMDYLTEHIVDLEQERGALLENLAQRDDQVIGERQRLETYKNGLEEARKYISRLEGDLAGKDNGANRHHEEMQNLKDQIKDLLAEKKTLDRKNKDFDSQIKAKDEKYAKLQARLNELEKLGMERSSNSKEDSLQDSRSGSKLMAIEDQEKLEDDITHLEERLQRVQSKLLEKDRTIDNLASSLADERKLNKTLRAELNQVQSVSTSSDTVDDRIVRNKWRGVDVKEQASELEFLRKQNKILNDEIKALRRNADNGVVHPVRLEKPDSNGAKAWNKVNTKVLSNNPTRASSLSPKLSSSKEDNKGQASSSGISGIVASFERRIATGDFTSDSNVLTSEETADIRRQLIDEQEQVSALQEQLRREKENVINLRAELAQVNTSGLPLSVCIDERLREKEREISRLQTLIEQYEKRQADTDEIFRSQRNKMEELKSAADMAEHEAKLYHERMIACEDEIDQLERQLTRYRQDVALGAEEKKDDSCGGEEELYRLRAQVAALQPELERTLTEIEELQREVDRLKRALRTEQGTAVEAQKQVELLKSTNDSEGDPNLSTKNQKKYDAEINGLKVEITNLQVSKAELEQETKKQIEELESMLEALEVEADEELDEKNKEIQDLKNQLSEKEEIVSRLERERTHLCTNMNDVSMSRKDEVDHLQSELIELTTEATSKSRESQVLKMKIEEVKKESMEVEQKLRRRLTSLQEELMEAKRNRRSQNKDELERLRKENVTLRETLRDVKSERLALQDRLESYISAKSSSKSVQVLRERNAALKQEVEKLSSRLEKMEDSITRVAI